MRPLLLLALLTSQVVAAQNPPPSHKVLTPDQVALQSEIAKWNVQYKVLRAQAQEALKAESDREKTEACPNASNTRAYEECYSAEIEKSQANYSKFASAIRAMLALTYPSMRGQEPASGPTGLSLTSDELVAEFDKLEAEAKNYREHASRAAYDQYKGGTLAPVFSAEATLHLLRSHMHEVAFVYGEKLSNH